MWSRRTTGEIHLGPPLQQEDSRNTATGVLMSGGVIWAGTLVQAPARLMFTLLNPCVQPWHLCSFHTISSRTIWQGKLELGSVQLEEVGWWLCSAPFSHGEDTQCPTVSKDGQPSRETPAPLNPDWSASNGMEGGHAMLYCCLGVSSMWLKVRTWEWDCQKIMMGMTACTFRAWILPQPLNPGSSKMYRCT